MNLVHITTIAGSHVAFCLCCTQTGVPGSNSWYFLSGLLVLSCLLMSSWWVWCISGAPSALGNCGKFFSLGVHCVINCNGDAILPDCGVTLPSNKPEIHGFPSFPAFSINFLATPTILSMNPLDLG